MLRKTTTTTTSNCLKDRRSEETTRKKRDDRWVFKLKRNSRISYDPTIKRFIIDGVHQYKGITHIIKKMFPIPRYHIQSGAEDENKIAKCKSLNHITHGKIVEEDVEFYYSKVCLRKLDPCSERLITEFTRRGWVPVKFQWRIFSEHMRVATAVDIACVDKKTGGIIILELKTSHISATDSYERGCGSFFKVGNAVVKGSYLNIHLIQLAVMVIMLKLEYNLTPQESYVVRVCPSSMFLYSVPNWCRTEAASILESIKTGAQCKNKKKKKFKNKQSRRSRNSIFK